MPHQCVRCNKLYPDGSQELIKGCTCGGKFFFFIKKKDIDRAKKMTSDLSIKDKEQMEQDVLDLIGDKIEDDAPVFLNFESVRVLKPGRFELDLVRLFKKKPLVYKLEDGKYIIDLVSTFKAKDKNVDD